MKRWLSVTAVMVLCLVLVIGIACGGGEEEAGVKKLKFGMGIPLSGAAGAVAGWPLMWSLEIYQDWYPEFTVGGDRYVWDFIEEDSMPGGAVSPAGGHASATKLIYEGGVDFLFETPIDAAKTAMAITEPLGKLLFIGYAGIFDIGPEHPHTFINMQINDLETLVFFDWFTKEYPEAKRVVCSRGGSATAEMQYRGIKAACDYYGLDLTAVESTGEVTVEYYPLATKYMTYDPELAMTSVSVAKCMWDMGYEGFIASNYWAEVGYGQVPWDKAAGKVLIHQPHPMEEPWPEVAAFATEYEERFGVEVTPAILLGLLMPRYLEQAMDMAGTVTDIDRIIEALETGTFDTALGPVHFGGEEINGIGHILMLPQAVWRVVGEGEYEVVAEYTAEELEQLAIEIYGVR